jgi:NTE family protein
MKKKICLFAVIVVSCILILSSCCRPQYNVKGMNTIPLPDQKSGQDDKTLVFVSLSGGGTRAAAMSWKALEEFRKIPYWYMDDNEQMVESTLAGEIDYISGISGGSFAAAAWCLYRDDMQLFRTRFIERNIQGDLVKNLFIPPSNGIKLISPYYDRINIASELYDNEVFDNTTFNDLPARPVLWINATNLALGARFTYDTTSFDYLHSNLSAYPIGYACAASSAFPILLSPITLKNYGESVDLNQDIDYRIAKMNARENLEMEAYCRAREVYNDKRNEFIHLADGGLVDNQGLQAIIDEFKTNGIINKRLNDATNPLKRLIIINVNAGVSSNDKSCRKESAPHINSVIEYTMVTSMDILSAKRWMGIKNQCNELNKAAIDIGETTKSLSQLEKPYTIEINFRNVTDEKTRKECNKLPTSFKLDAEQLRLIDRTVAELVNEEPEIIRLKSSLE